MVPLKDKLKSVFHPLQLKLNPSPVSHLFSNLIRGHFSVISSRPEVHNGMIKNLMDSTIIS